MCAQKPAWFEERALWRTSLPQEDSGSQCGFVCAGLCARQDPLSIAQHASGRTCASVPPAAFGQLGILSPHLGHLHPAGQEGSGLSLPAQGPSICGVSTGPSVPTSMWLKD